jgi:hypothetical protein
MTIRKKCLRDGHKWVTWGPGCGNHCGRWFCDAKHDPLMALIEAGLRRKR